MNLKLTSGEGLPNPSLRFGGFGIVELHYLALAILLTTVFVVFAQTFGSMLNTWLRSATFLHGILIFPISGYLIWRKRRELRQLKPEICWTGAPVLLILSLAWWVADALGIQVAKQFAVIAMIGAAVVTVMGPRFAGRIAFPLGYLIFAVPIGEALVPYLIDYTAAFTVKALNFTGIPVFRDGRYFSIPAGDFEVARACSGIRYLLAALALGTLFAHFMFRSNSKRAYFMLFSIVMPIVANGLRAYGIVLLAQYVSVDFATGVDHIIFGWIFFGVVIFLMFIIGSRFSDRDSEMIHRSPTEQTVSRQKFEAVGHPMATLALLGISTVCVVAGPALAASVAGRAPSLDSMAIGLPTDLRGWSAVVSEDSDWRPEYRGAHHEAFGRYTRGDSSVDLAVAQYRGTQQQGVELASSENSIVDSARWRIGNMQTILVRLDNGSEFRINEAIVQSRSDMRVVWFWYDVDGAHAISDLQVKLLEARGMILGVRSQSSAVLVSTGASSDIEADRALLREFVRVAFDPILECISGSGEQRRCGFRSTKTGVR